MRDLADLLPEMAPAYLDRVAVDATGLTGAWDLKAGVGWRGAH